MRALKMARADELAAQNIYDKFLKSPAVPEDIKTRISEIKNDEINHEAILQEISLKLDDGYMAQMQAGLKE